MYKLFLQIICQFSHQNIAYITVNDMTISIQWLREKKTWRFSTPLCPIHSSLSFLGSSSAFHWDNTPAFLQWDITSDHVVLMDELEMKKSQYLAFKTKMQDFLQLSEEWKDILKTLIFK